jgi:hypothetical protein
MPPKTTEAEFDALVARAGLPLTTEHKARLYAVFHGIEAMQERIRTPAPAAVAEPATTFSTEPGR